MAIRRTKITTYNSINTAAITHTFSHESNDYYRGLVVNVYQASGVAPTSVTFNGVAMTFVQTSTLSFINQYVLQAPPLGTYNVVITYPNARQTYAVAASYANASQSALVNTFFTSFSSSSNVSISVTPTVADTWAITMGTDSGLETISNGTFFEINDAGSVAYVRNGDSTGAVLTANVVNNVRVSSASSSFDVEGAVIVIAPEIAIPILNTTTYDNLSQTSVRALSEVLYDGDATITERGFVYDTFTLPTIADSKKVVTGTVGAYTGDITGLTVNTTYYVRAYAINANGTAYSNEVTFTTLNIPQYELQYELGASDGDTYIGQINVTGTVGTITVQLGSAGTSTVITAGAGASTFTGTYSGLSGLIITRSADFNGTIDNVYYAKVPLGTTIDWTLNTVAITTSIPSEVFFKRVEDQVFNNFRFYRYLDLLFKDLDGFVTVTVRQEREDNTTEKSKVFVVGNTGSGTVSPFQKKRISFLCKDQAIIIGLSNDNLNETFSIAQYLLIGDKKPRRTISPSKIISIS